MKILTTPRMERCIGCHSCSLACARLVHKRLSWDTAGIRIRSSGGLSTGFEARICLACDPAPCAAGLPDGRVLAEEGRGSARAQEPLHPLRRVREGLPRGCHLSRPHAGTLCLHPLRPVRSLLPPRLPGDERGCGSRTCAAGRCVMIRDHFRVLVVDLGTGRGTVVNVDGRDRVAGGSGLAAHPVQKYGHAGQAVERSRSAAHLRHRPSDRLLPAHEQDRLRLQVALSRSVRGKPRRRALGALAPLCRPRRPRAEGQGQGAVRPLCRLAAPGAEAGPLSLGQGPCIDRQDAARHVQGSGPPDHPAHRTGRRERIGHGLHQRPTPTATSGGWEAAR